MSPFHLALLLTIPRIINTTTTNNTTQNHRGLFSFLFDSCNCRCGIPNREGKIFSGEFVGSHEFPWLVLVHVVGGKTSVGSLINNRYVLSTANVVKSATPFDVKVTVGLYDRCQADISSTRHSTEKLIIHPDYHPEKETYNLALIKLTSPVAFERRVSPICLPYPSSRYVGQVGTAISWPEAKEESENLFCRARKMGLPILEEGHCGSSQGIGCAGVVGAPGLICKDDEGSPVMYRSYKGVYELIGLFTTGNECSGQVGVSYYTMIGRNLGWIVQNTKDACYCFKT